MYTAPWTDSIVFSSKLLSVATLITVDFSGIHSVGILKELLGTPETITFELFTQSSMLSSVSLLTFPPWNSRISYSVLWVYQMLVALNFVPVSAGRFPSCFRCRYVLLSVAECCLYGVTLFNVAQCYLILFNVVRCYPVLFLADWCCYVFSVDRWCLMIFNAVLSCLMLFNNVQGCWMMLDVV